MIALLRNALNLLDEQGGEEVLKFLMNQQNPDGGFRDRGGRSDLYYSLFGGLMLRAGESEVRSLKSEDLLPEREAVEGAILKLSKFIAQQSNSKVSGFIEKCCLILLQKELNAGQNSQIRALVSLG